MMVAAQTNIVLQRICRVNLLGIDVDFRLNIADEPVLEAESLGTLLEYQRHRKCRELVQRLIDNGRLSCTAPRRGAPQNSADNSTFCETDRPIADVYSVEVIAPHGVRLGTTEQLWLTERACLLVATASDTERAWQVRTALVDFFLEARRQRVVHSETAANAAAQRALDEARALHMSVVEQLELDARVRKLEQRRERKPRTVMPAGAVDSTSLEASLTTLLEQTPPDAEISIPDITRALGLDIDDGLSRKLGILLSRAGWTPTHRVRVNGAQQRMYRPGINGEQLVAEMEKAIASVGCADITAREALAANPMLARFGDTPHQLGLTLRGLHGKAFGGRRLVAIPSRKDVARWYVETSELSSSRCAHLSLWLSAPHSAPSPDSSHR